MFVAKTISQLQDAIRESVQEVMVIGKLANIVPEMSDPVAAGSKREIPNDFSFTNLFEKFNCTATYDTSKNIIATVFQRRESLSGE